MKLVMSKQKIDLRQSVIEWNNKFPFDYWWRKFYSIPFGSAKHREMCFIDMAFEFIEHTEMEMLKIREAREKRRRSDIENNKLYENSSVVHMSKKEIQEEFDNLDLDKFA